MLKKMALCNVFWQKNNIFFLKGCVQFLNASYVFFLEIEESDEHWWICPGFLMDGTTGFLRLLLLIYLLKQAVPFDIRNKSWCIRDLWQNIVCEKMSPTSSNSLIIISRPENPSELIWSVDGFRSFTLCVLTQSWQSPGHLLQPKKVLVKNQNHAIFPNHNL